MAKPNLAVVKPDTDPNLVLATQAITLKKEIDRLTKEFEVPKQALIKAANGETLTINVPGQGRVMVTAKTDPRPTGKTGYRFDAAAFQLLSPRLRKRLIDAGVVSQFEITNGGADPTLRVTLNA